jgi:TolB-like protein/DNA-binding winged helix-turn-helix (wHTH) protein/tetratricopeptide (TPR) repeat protein
MQDRTPVYAFGEWRLDAAQRLLFRRDTLVPLPPKVLETLLVLVEQHGRIVEKEELLSRLWPGTFVEEGNVLRNVSTLRKALGDGDAEDASRYIETIPKRGYRFVAPVELIEPQMSAAAAPIPPPLRSRKILLALTALGVVLLASGWLAWRWLFLPVPAERVVLAVLPFENLSGDPAHEYLSDGLTEEMITQLAGLNPDRISVIARTSSMKYKGARKSVQEIGRELGVDYVLEGSLRREGVHVRVSAQLIRVSDQIHLWARSFDRDLGGTVNVQEDVADSITGQVHVALGHSVQAAPRRRPVTPEAFDAYLKGRFEWNKRTPAGLLKGLEHFNEALAKDPNYAAAHAGIADSYNLLANYAVLSPADGFPRAQQAARKALALDETMADAHASLGFAAFHFDYDWPGAERAYRRAIELNPSYSAAHQWYAELLACLGRYDEALAQALRARELDPLSLTPRINIGRTHWLGRRFDRAISEMHAVLKQDPNHAWANVYLAMSLSETGQHAEAMMAAEKTKPLSGGHPGFLFAFCHARAGRVTEAREVLSYWKARRKQANVDPVFLAGIHAALGEEQQGLDLLEQAVAERSLFVPYVATQAWLDPLRSSPRFRILLERLKLPAQPAFPGK